MHYIQCIIVLHGVNTGLTLTLLLILTNPPGFMY